MTTTTTAAHKQQNQRRQRRRRYHKMKENIPKIRTDDCIYAWMNEWLSEWVSECGDEWGVWSWFIFRKQKIERVSLCKHILSIK